MTWPAEALTRVEKSVLRVVRLWHRALSLKAAWDGNPYRISTGPEGSARYRRGPSPDRPAASAPASGPGHPPIPRPTPPRMKRGMSRTCQPASPKPTTACSTRLLSSGKPSVAPNLVATSTESTHRPRMTLSFLPILPKFQELTPTIATLTREQMQRQAPSIFAATPWHGMSARYRQVPSIEVLDMLAD